MVPSFRPELTTSSRDPPGADKRNTQSTARSDVKAFIVEESNCWPVTGVVVTREGAVVDVAEVVVEVVGTEVVVEVAGVVVPAPAVALPATVRVNSRPRYVTTATMGAETRANAETTSTPAATP
jgi:hypothetical protein